MGLACMRGDAASVLVAGALSWRASCPRGSDFAALSLGITSFRGVTVTSSIGSSRYYSPCSSRAAAVDYRVRAARAARVTTVKIYWYP
jgi:hypothetical protein